MSVPLTATTPHMAETWHPSADLCRRFLEGRVSAPEKRAFVRHLIGQCEDCRALVGRIAAEGGYWFGKRGAKAYVEGDYAAAFQAAFKFATTLEREVALAHLRGWAHWSALDPLLPQERLSVVIEHKDWHHWGLFRALLDAAGKYRSRDPQEAADIALLALNVVNLLDPLAVGGEAAAKDMRARAFGILADCRRLAADLEAARHAIAEAWRWNEEGAGDPLDKAHLYRVDASYAAAVGEFETAEAILEKALSLFLAAGQPHLQGRTLVAMGETIGYVSPDRGIAHIEHGLRLLSPECLAQDLLRDFLLVTIDLTEAHVGQGELATALRLLAETTPTLAGWSLHQNGLAAWRTFQKILDGRRARRTAAHPPLFDQVRLYFRRYWLVPGAEFRVL